MTHEIKLDADKHDIHDLIRYLEGDHHMSVYDRMQVVKELRTQVEPAVEEPTERWSIIAANVPGSHFLEPKQLVKTDAGWLDSDGNEWGSFDSFSDVEVLRVGIGNQQDEKNAYVAGFTGAKRSAAYQIHALREAAITAERKDAYDKAILAVEGLQP